MKIESDGTQIKGYYVDRRHHLDPGRPGREPAGQRQGRLLRAGQRGGHARRPPSSTTSSSTAAPAAVGRAARATTSPAPASTRRSGTRSSARTPRKYAVNNGALTITTVGRRHLHQQRSVRHAELHPADGGSHRQRLRARDQALRHAQRRLRPGRHPGLQRRRQLRQARCDLGHEQHRGSTASSSASETAGATANPQPQVNVPAGTANIWLRLTKAGHELLGRVLVRRHDLDVDRRRPSPAHRAPGSSASTRSASTTRPARP